MSLKIIFAGVPANVTLDSRCLRATTDLIPTIESFDITAPLVTVTPSPNHTLSQIFIGAWVLFFEPF